MGYADRPSLEGANRRGAQEFSPHGQACNLGARSDPRIGAQPRKASIHHLNTFGHKGDQVASDQPSIGRRISRTLIRFLIAVLIGVGATLAWQSDSAKQMVVARAPALVWLLSVSSPVAATTPPDQVQQIELLATNLYVVRRSLEQLIIKQDQMAQNIAALQAVEEDIRQKMASTPASLSLPSSVPQQKLPQPRAHSSTALPSSVARSTGPPVLTR